MNKKRNRAFIIILVLIIIFIIILNPRKIYYENKLIEKSYSRQSINTIYKYNKEKDILRRKYSYSLDEIFSSKEYNNSYYNIYLKINTQNIPNEVSYINSLIKKGYSIKEINYILLRGDKKSIESFIKKQRRNNIIDYLKYDYSKLALLNRYILYKENNNATFEDSVKYVNIDLDKEDYTNYNVINRFSFDMIVNKHNYLNDNFIPNDLIIVDKKYAVDNKQMINCIVYENFKKMSDDCKNETGSRVLIKSGYRSFNEQKNIYDFYEKLNGSNYAKKYVANAGFSEHQTGLAIDIKDEKSDLFDNTNSKKWIDNNAHKYGFILRYSNNNQNITGYNYESWHYRFVGEKIAKYIYEKNISLEEYLFAD